MSILGTRVVRKEDPKFLTVGGTYVDDVRDPRLEGAARATFVRSTMAHARISSIDVTEAQAAPGVIAVLTGADLGLAPLPPSIPLLNQSMVRPLLADGTVRFVGEPVALVLSEDGPSGEDAAELVFVDYEPLQAVVDPEDAVRDEVVLHGEAGTNLAMEMDFGSDPDLFEGCEVVVSQRVVNQRVAGAPLEVRAGAAAWGEDGRCTYWCSTQAPQASRDTIQTALGLEPGTVHLIAPDVGGGFGAKIGCSAEDIVVAWAARHLGRPVRWVETRTENMTNMGHGRAQIQRLTIGGRRDGTVEAYRLELLQDTGAYPAMGGILPYLTRTMSAGVYAFPKVECNLRSVATNTAPTVAYRGAGRPEATAAGERAMDLFAAEIGMDPAEVRRKNLIPTDAFPYTTAVGTTYDIGDYTGALDRALEASGYEQLRAEQARRRQEGGRVAVGIGISIYVEVTAGPTAGGEHGRVVVNADGTATVYTGTSPHGQGHVTSWSMIVSDRLGIPMDDIQVVHGDTDLIPNGVGTFGSRSLQLGGTAVHEAAGKVLDVARGLAGDLLEANPDDVVLDAQSGRFHVRGTPAVSKTWVEVAAAAGEGGLDVETEFTAESPTFPFGAHVAVVEVDLDTGKVTLVRMITVDDAGRLLNPLLVEGQRHGGIAQGVAQALLEEIVYDADGNPVTSNFADYAFVSACELPSFELVAMETPTPVNPMGAKGIGESGTIGSTPAVQSAVVDALAHLGVRHVDMPATSERVWRAISAVANGSAA
ncbi:MAG: Carbon monoxide dehydrogenase large chain [uncultured Acidimicrobiales bacterium]|uniref:Carbon monoxide dehydrogenase large chain n=1 Tax=uncultured Acidimicrobiales bacterium TaxID=310071 RepID=A0A6J4J0D4_9ACTN|nr:MAG: Carbon monoxide dehydrogenase large chain [uncultured Acidimicrobiales bacterium]